MDLSLIVVIQEPDGQFFKMEIEGLMSHVVQGSCYIGTQSEVYNAELHAIAEGLQQIGQTGVTPGKMYICMDNQAAIDTLWDNKLNSEPARHAIKQANILKAQGWNILAIWTPAHQYLETNWQISLPKREQSQQILYVNIRAQQGHGCICMPARIYLYIFKIKICLLKGIINSYCLFSPYSLRP
jgi:ribonuclease HI